MIKLKRLRYQILAKNKIKTITWWIPLALTFNYSLPNFYDILEKSCHILHIHNQLHKIFCEKPIIAHNQHRNLKDIIGGTTFTNNQEVHKPLKITRRLMQTMFKTNEQLLLQASHNHEKIWKQCNKLLI